MRNFFFSVCLISSPLLFSQQISIPRIEQMPDLPQPYEMRDWLRVAQRYDSLVYDLSLTGDHLPLTAINSETVNYPEQESYVIQTYVGSFSPTSGEAINMIPSVIGASLCGIDKSNQFGKNWVEMCREFFNKSTGEMVYLNNPRGQSGHDWWYETMPNIFFYQLKTLYPNIADFDTQFITVADRWYEAVREMGGNNSPWNVPEMAYRAWNLLQMEPLTEGVKEPEAAGALAWIFYAAYMETGSSEYRIAAEWCMEYLNSLNTNPSYELQLAYGTLTAAKMNAELGTRYDVNKMLNWCFDIGPLRNWGSVTGTWGGLDCYGLIGEQSDGGVAYAFTMNSFQHAATLAPLVRYDDRYAGALGKWLLNLANASRLFYSAYLPGENQDDKTWSSMYDPNSVIAYEALKETLNGEAPFATGDAVGGGWAASNLALYGSSHVGMLGGIIQTTNIEGVLQVDLLKSDFYHDTAYSTYLYYNPYATEQQVEIDPGVDAYDVYESVSNQFIASGQSGTATFTIPASSAVVIVIVPSGSEISYAYDLTMANGIVIDYLNGSITENYPPRIKSLAAPDTLVLTSSNHTIYCTAEDQDGDALQYKWSAGDGQWTSDSTFDWSVPEAEGKYRVSCVVKDPGGLTDSLNISFQAVERITAAPEIVSITAEPRKVHPGATVELSCEAADINNDPLQYYWSADEGTFQGEGSIVTWTSPTSDGIVDIRCEVVNLDLLSDTGSLKLLVKDTAWSQDGELVAGYYLNGNGLDFSKNNNHGTPYSITWVPNYKGDAGLAASFNGTSSRFVVPDREYLNFTSGLSFMCRMKPEVNVSGEQFIASHGSWQNRWKLSLINDNQLRFTINGSAGITDLDSETSLQPGTWYHLAAIYDGQHLEIYIDGKLNAFKVWNGTINKANYDLLFGQMLPDNNAYNFNGSIDDIRIYNAGIKEQLIEQDYAGALSVGPSALINSPFLIYPNPASEHSEIKLNFSGIIPEKIRISEASGETVWSIEFQDISLINGSYLLPIHHLSSGFYIVSVNEHDKTYTQKLVIL
ncbi:MAG: LamG-like jellyroll fold domain-containing protein [Bacteroidales bacterium]